MGVDEFGANAWKLAATDADGVSLANEIGLFGSRLQLLDDKALYLPDEEALLVSDVHLGKAETFQALGIPISSAMNEENLVRLRQICAQAKTQKAVHLRRPVSL